MIPSPANHNCDGSPTKSLILDMRRSGENSDFWKLNFGKRPDGEFYHAADDPACIHNLAKITDHTDRTDAMRKQMESELKTQGDPRMNGEGAIFDRYPVATDAARFYERMIGEGKKPNAGWVNPGDFEKENPEE